MPRIDGVEDAIGSGRWADAKGVKGGGKISKGGQSFADIRKQEKREAAGTETRAKQRNETVAERQRLRLR